MSAQLKVEMREVGRSGSLDRVRSFLQEHPEMLNEYVSGWLTVGHEHPFSVRGLDDSFFFFSSLLG